MVDGAMPSKMDKRMRRHFEKTTPHVDCWRISQRIIIEAKPKEDRKGMELLENIKQSLNR